MNIAAMIEERIQEEVKKRVAAVQVAMERALRGAAGDVKRGRPPGKVKLGRPPGKAKRSIVITPARRAAMKLQGQYLGLLRTLKGKDRDRVKNLAKEKSVKVAIAAGHKIKK